MESIKKIIGKTKYQFLKGFEILTELEQNQVDEFEKVNGGVYSSNEYSKDYVRKLKNPVVNKPQALTKKWIWESFKESFLENEGKWFIETNETLQNIKPLVYYFLGDIETFKQCKNVSTLSKPSLEKGLLIIGNYGNGKTSVFRAFEKALKQTDLIFKGYSANEAVTMFEACKDAQEKEEFFKIMNKGTRYFDDIKTERMASNYGKTQLFKDILEARYNNKVRTYITCNFKENYPNDLNKAFDEFGEKYGSRVFDRLFEMFNIIEFTGKSFRE